MIVIITLASLFFVFTLQNKPAEGTILELKPDAPDASEAKKEELIVLDGKYVKFNYPAIYNRIESQKNANLETINLLSTPSQGGEIVVSVTQGLLAENSALKLRRLQKELYGEQPSNIAGAAGFIFTKRPPGFEKTAIAEGDDKVVSISVSNESGKDLSDVFEGVTKSFIWK